MTHNAPDPAEFHLLFGPRQPRAVYYKRDFVDFAMMIAVSALVVGLVYGPRSVVAVAGFALCAFMLVMFVVRHGVELTVPLILRRPQDVLWMLVYKLRNIRLPYLLALAVFLLENVIIAATPGLPHHVELVRKAALVLFYVHLIAITAYRTVILAGHLRNRELVREVLMQTTWKRFVSADSSVTREIIHAYCTGVLTHIILLAPWYLAIRYGSSSLLLLPLVFAADFFIHLKWTTAIVYWFYRDHWLGHNAELEFVWLHGTHHDSLPSALMAVAENGLLEGFLRMTIGTPITFYNPLAAFIIFTLEIKLDMDVHQYIPGLYPRTPIKVMEVTQHSTHHYGSIEPYGHAIKVSQPGREADYKHLFRRLPDELRNSARLDEELNGFVWDNPTHKRTLSLYRQYHTRPSAAVPVAAVETISAGADQ